MLRCNDCRSLATPHVFFSLKALRVGHEVCPVIAVNIGSFYLYDEVIIQPILMLSFVYT